MAMRGVQGWTLVLLLIAAAPAAAQESVSLQFQNGLVTLRAQNVPVRTILSEWARVGGAHVVNADRVLGGPVTMELTSLPERQALDILLRSVAGYVLGPRTVSAADASMFDRILILPTSSTPPNTRPAAPAAADNPRRVPLPAFLARRPDLGVEGPPRPRVATPGIFGPDFRENPPTPPAAPEPVHGDGSDADPENPTPVIVTPANPFGLPAGSATTPGPSAVVPH